MGIFMGTQSMRHNSTAHDNSTDSQLDYGSPCYGEGLHLRIALTFTRHFYFEGKAIQKLLLIKDKPCEKSSLYLLILL